jgi:hypothetical protein
MQTTEAIITRLWRLIACGFVAATLLYSQSTEAWSLPRPTQYILFLRVHAWQAQHRNIHGSRGLNQAADLMKVKPTDVELLDRVAATFVEQDRALAEEARRYHQIREENREAVDLAAVKAFTARREANAVAAFEIIYSRVSRESATRLQEFLDTTFRKSMGAFGR